MSQNASGKASDSNDGVNKTVSPSDCGGDEYKQQEWLKNQYLELDKTMAEIANETNCTAGTISRWIDKHGINKKDFGEVISKSKKHNLRQKVDVLEEKYWEERCSMKELANEFDVSLWLIKNIFKDNDIPTRKGGETQRKSGPYNNKEWLIEEYVNNGRSIPDIANEFNVSNGVIHRRLKKFDIERHNTGHISENYWEDKKYTNEDFLRREYVKKGKTVPEIAKNLPVCRDAIYRWMDKYNIERERDMSGENHPDWDGGAADYYGENWYEMKKKVRNRDNNTCQDCGYKPSPNELKLDVHHITPIKDFEQPENANTMDNLILLCRKCHIKWEGTYLRPDNRNE